MLIIGSDIWKLRIFCLKRQIIKKKEESIMKKIFKGLSALAIASAISLNTLTVNAADACEPGEVEYTNYYMFLNEDTVDFLTKGVNDAPAGTIFTLYNGADKTNDIANVKVLDKNYVKITDGTKSNTKSDSSIVWTVPEFWQKFYKGFKNMKEGYVGEFPEENESYYFHKEWWQCQDGNFTDCTAREHITADSTKALTDYLEANISSIASSALVTKATTLPETFITVPNDIGGTTTSSTLRWNVTRKITSSDVLEGTAIGTTTKKNWSPAAYYVKYCKSSGTTPETEKKITYDANTTAQVVEMPSPNPFTFKEKCTYITTNTPKRTDGYTFLGWSEDKDAKKGDPKYAPNAQYCEERDITLYAIWEPIEKNPDGSYTVTYDANGGKNAPSAQTTPSGSCMNISSGKPTLAKNNFLGWSRDKDAKEPDPRYKAGEEYCGADGNITLYAVWQVQSGISAHFVAFSLVAIAAAAALVVAQKKDLFKQI